MSPFHLLLQLGLKRPVAALHFRLNLRATITTMMTRIALQLRLRAPVLAWQQRSADAAAVALPRGRSGSAAGEEPWMLEVMRCAPSAGDVGRVTCDV
jgi:hypothetical protein